jgi:hypothetical protein
MRQMVMSHRHAGTWRMTRYRGDGALILLDGAFFGSGQIGGAVSSSI